MNLQTNYHPITAPGLSTKNLHCGIIKVTPQSKIVYRIEFYITCNYFSEQPFDGIDEVYN